MDKHKSSEANSTKKDKGCAIRKDKMSEDEIFLKMLLETFSPKTNDFMVGLGMYNF